MQASSGMDIPATNTEHKPEKIEDGKEGVSLFHCNLYDTELVHKIAQAFLPGIATACVDNTSGEIFKTPASVAVELRKEMVDYITQRSENFVAETFILEGGTDVEVSDHPYDIISDFVDDFASLKRNLFSRVSGWLLSEKREDKIDDFVQEMEINGFWLNDKREAIAQALLKNVDFKNKYHCSMKFDSAEELAEHVGSCGFRSMTCENEGCNAMFSSRHREKHDSGCPFKIIPCEQKCSESIMRREMDRHCITVCPMRLVSCPFYSVGCQSPIPHSMLEQHRSSAVHSHLLYVLRNIHKKTSDDDLKQRVDQLEKESSSGQLEKARDVRSLISVVKDLETKLGPFKPNRENKNKEDTAETLNLAGELEKAEK
ncbi:TRAF-like [Trema orientale]|uniref:TRAF-like n=1 Tax=Trema orientale TaxID=63057 RepID=A0A2P5EA32_TREOI|nr:TRAF-like [Trema orientale]